MGSVCTAPILTDLKIKQENAKTETWFLALNILCLSLVCHLRSRDLGRVIEFIHVSSFFCKLEETLLQELL